MKIHFLPKVLDRGGLKTNKMIKNPFLPATTMFYLKMVEFKIFFCIIIFIEKKNYSIDFSIFIYLSSCYLNEKY